MDFDFRWLLLILPAAFALGWLASRLDLRQAKRDPRDAPHAYFKGLNLLLNEQHDKAIDAFIEAVQHDPDTVDLHFALGALFRRRGETERAVRVHQHLMQRGDLPAVERARAQHALAQDFFKAGLFDRAEAAYRALSGTPFEGEAELALLSLYERGRDWEQAQRMAQALETRGVGSFATRQAHHLCELALQSQADGALQAAVGLLRQAHQLAPRAPRPLLLLGQASLRSGQASEALGLFETLLTVAPDAFNLAAGHYAEAANIAGETARALANLETQYTLAPSMALVLALNALAPDAQEARLSAHLMRHPAALDGARRLLALAPTEAGSSQAALQNALDRAVKPRTRYRCAACGFESGHYFWQCPGCLSWDSFPPHPIEEL
ncbi:lipopolysaccharide assembly protein LapB [Inhella gelatinilytica]|uniref:Lipopolysaccharide assembly protein B n=1 Tax=Inhella gelatinilytica TaxID=2795030 RepID=A0A931IV62_9BURK|nr:lipopolysaccharide assembly protein LapB [Inhella gelatinilytica]MBH9553375.1 lipopolysaccharide assembly protein LapB [Inhella gelatinilytica]